jgi:hypothetical protein
MTDNRMANRFVSTELSGHFGTAFTVGTQVIADNSKVDIVQQARQSPFVFIFTKTPGEGAHDCFRGKHMFDQIFIRDILADGD